MRRGIVGSWAYAAVSHTAMGGTRRLVRGVTIILAFLIPGFSVIPTLLVYFLLGYVLPETDEF